MKKDSQITTAANSKIMNAVQKPTLYAATEDIESPHDFTSQNDLPGTGAIKNAAKKTPNIKSRGKSK